MPKPKLNTDFTIGLVGLMAGSLILFVWVPLDVDTGLIEKVRSQVVIGDAMAPSLAASILIIGSLLMILQSFRNREETDLSWNNIKFLVMLLVLLGLSMAVMRWAGPFAAYLFNADYRSLRDTVPWKYIGYFLGGIIMVFSLISMMEHRMRWRTLIISIIVVVVLIMIYDLPFENLQLPPNGDV
jgi:hypothetical protein